MRAVVECFVEEDEFALSRSPGGVQPKRPRTESMEPAKKLDFGRHKFTECPRDIHGVDRCSASSECQFRLAEASAAFEDPIFQLDATMLDDHARGNELIGCEANRFLVSAHEMRRMSDRNYVGERRLILIELRVVGSSADEIRVHRTCSWNASASEFGSCPHLNRSGSIRFAARRSSQCEP